MIEKSGSRYQVRFGTYSAPAYALHATFDDIVEAGIVADILIDAERALLRVIVVDTQFVCQSGARMSKFYSVHDIDWVTHGTIERARRKRIARSRM